MPIATAPKTYFTPDTQMDASTTLPLAGARLYVFGSQPPEGLLVLEREGGIVIAGDCLQNWSETDAYFSGVGKLMMKMMGFIKPHNVGPAWFKRAKPPLDDLRGVLELGFEHLLPAHGKPVIGDAKARFRPRIEALVKP
jgi:hypothetical protein